MEWVIFALIATTLFGIQNFVYKIANEKKCNLFLLTIFFYLTVAVLSLITFLFSGFNITNVLITLALGFLFAALFYFKTLGQLKALEYLPTNKVFPITSSAAILTVILALLIFRESLNFIQILGIIVIIASIILIHDEAKKRKDYPKKKSGFLIAFLVIIPAAGVEIINKFAALKTDLSSFILISYLFAVTISLVGHRIQNSRKKSNTYESIKLGIIIGVVNFVGFYSGLTAMKYGPLSLIAPILTACIVITIILARIIYKEELSIKQIILIILIVVGIVLLRI